MTMINIKYMSDLATEYLRSNIAFATHQLAENPEDSSWLKQCLSGEIYVGKKHTIRDFRLAIPEDEKDKETDLANSILLYESLSQLPNYVLTDERFWLWINFEKGYQVANKLMPPSPGSAVFKDHWLFTTGKRRGLFFGVLSRCFFRVALTYDETLLDKYELTRFVIENPERFRNLTWRTYSSSKQIVLGILKAEKDFLNDFKVEKPGYYVELAKSMSRLGSVRLLDAIPEAEIRDLAYERLWEIASAGESIKQD